MLYDHEANRHNHSVKGAYQALRLLFPDRFPRSVLDVGCGQGTWLKAAMSCGATEVVGVDGVALPAAKLLISDQVFHVADLNKPLDLQRRFELVLCLETVEHLVPDAAQTIVATLAKHGDRILFSGAAPGQPGMNHLNCQWPSYWQTLFNERGFVCSDAVRWTIWDMPEIEPWYRQNLFLAVYDDVAAGSEPRIRPVLHPDMLKVYTVDLLQRERDVIAQGSLHWRWYLGVPFRSALAKLRRKLRT